MVKENIFWRNIAKWIDEWKAEKVLSNSKLYNYIKHFLILASRSTGCFLISFFASLLSISVGITISAIGLKIYATSAGIKKNESMIKKQK